MGIYITRYPCYFVQLFFKKIATYSTFYAIPKFTYLTSSSCYLYYVMCIIIVYQSVNLASNTVTSTGSIQSYNLRNKMETARRFEAQERDESSW